MTVAFAVEPEPDREPHEVLGVAKDAPVPVVKDAVRKLVKEGHGDQGGELSPHRGECL